MKQTVKLLFFSVMTVVLVSVGLGTVDMYEKSSENQHTSVDLPTDEPKEPDA